jgi:hypothetical protein
MTASEAVPSGARSKAMDGDLEQMFDSIDIVLGH